MPIRRADEIGEKLGDRTGLFQAKWGLWINANLRHKTALARDRASELVTLAQRSGDGELLLEAYHCQWSTAFFRGDVWTRWMAPGVESSSTTWPVTVTSVTNSAVMIPVFARTACAATRCSWRATGKTREQSLAQAVALAEMLDHPNSLAHGLHNSGIGHMSRCRACTAPCQPN